MLIGTERVHLRPDLGNAATLDAKDVDPRPSGSPSRRRKLPQRSLVRSRCRVPLHDVVALNQKQIKRVSQIGEGAQKIVHMAVTPSRFITAG